MPVRGAKPKPFAQTRHRNRPAHEWLEVPNTPYSGERPELPRKRTITTPFGPKDLALGAMTKTWWASTSTMPHCVLWTASDWSFALATALVADAAFSGGVGAATELRNREKVLGTTVDFRRDLRIRYVTVAPVSPLREVTNLDEYRDL